jgi:threonine synthase
MRYFSTNREARPATFREALFAGLAPDGGLYVPEILPRLPEKVIQNIEDQTLHSLATTISKLFIDDIPELKLEGLVHEALTFPIPLNCLDDNICILELFHGPTLAFKDVGARFMARMISEYLRRDHREVTIVVATSGDTGSAVAHGFFGVPNVQVVILYPSGRVSPLQERQMTTLGGNIHAFEVDGSFDDCQRMVKAMLADRGLVRRFHLTTANSINIGRLIPQIISFAWAAAQWKQRAGRAPGRPSVVVPSGNFGNVCAALYAREMGIPFGWITAATNANDVVPQYLSSGNLSPQESKRTISNAMDVGNPSNIARIESLFGGTIEGVCTNLSSVSISDAATIAEMCSTYEEYGVVLDPHTAVGVAGARQLGNVPVIVAGTAHPAKFPEVIHQALGIDIPRPPALESVLKLKKMSVPISAEVEEMHGALAAIGS